MSIDPGPQIIIVVVSLFLSLFFDLLQFSYNYLNSYKIDSLNENGQISERQKKELKTIIDDFSAVRGALTLLDFFSNSLVIFSSVLLGFYYYGKNGAIGFMIAGVFLILIIGENLPYYISLANFEKISLKFIRFTRIITRILHPLVFLIKAISEMMAKIFGFDKTKEEPKITEDELYNAMNLSKDEGLLDVEEYGMIERVFEFSDISVKDVMTPRTEMATVSIDDTLEEIVDVFQDEGYSRLPVYEKDIDNIIGIIHIKDLIPYFRDRKLIDINEILRKPIYSFEAQKTTELFNQMRINNSTMAIVLDEYGGTEGLVTIEDLIEEIVGEIDDEHDVEVVEDSIKKLNNNSYELEGKLRLEELEEIMGIKLESEEMETVGGFVTEKLDKIPDEGEIFIYNNLEFRVLKLDKNRIDKLKMTILK